MAQRKISIRLNRKDIQDTIQKLETIEKNLIRRQNEFVRRLAQVGIPIIQQNINMAVGDSNKTHTTRIEISNSPNKTIAKLVVEGEDIIFIEFGAGVHYNTPAGTSPHPKGEKKGYTIGSYGYGHGAKDFWYYKDETGEYVRSYGTRATMPLYKASLKMRDEMVRIAKEVFFNDLV